MTTAGKHRFAGRKLAAPHEKKTEKIELIGRIGRLLPGRGLLANIGDQRADIVIALSLPALVRRHDDEPASLGIDAVANGAEDLAHPTSVSTARPP